MAFIPEELHKKLDNEGLEWRGSRKIAPITMVMGKGGQAKAAYIPKAGYYSCELDGQEDLDRVSGKIADAFAAFNKRSKGRLGYKLEILHAPEPVLLKLYVQSVLAEPRNAKA